MSLARWPAIFPPYKFSLPDSAAGDIPMQPPGGSPLDLQLCAEFPQVFYKIRI